MNNMTKFIMPLDNPRVTSKYGWRTIFGSKEWHQGVDLVDKKLGAKAPIYAMADGTVSYAGTLSSYGLVVRIKHRINGVNYETLYAHLSKINVKVGQRVKQADVIGIIGTTGRSTGIHLHAELHVGGFWSKGQPLAKDVLKYVKLSDTPSDLRNKTVTKPSPKNTKPERKIKMLKDATSNTLINSFVKDLEKALSTGKIKDKKWIEQAKKGTMTLADAILLMNYIK